LRYCCVVWSVRLREVLRVLLREREPLAVPDAAFWRRLSSGGASPRVDLSRALGDIRLGC